MIQPQLGWGDRARGRHFHRFRRLLVRHDAFGGRHFARAARRLRRAATFFLEGGIIPSDAACCPQKAAEYLLRASCCIWRAASCLQRAAFNLLSHDDMLSERTIFYILRAARRLQATVTLSEGGRVPSYDVMLHLEGGIMPSEHGIQPSDGDMLS